jgi:hypothetical protein
MTTFDEGQVVTFTGYTEENDDDKPDNWEALTVGENYTIVEVHNESGKDPCFFLEANNPGFDDTKRASKKANPRTIRVDVFADEIEIVEIAAEAAVAELDDDVEVVEPEVVDDAVEVEEASAAPKKTTKKKAASKKAAKKTAAKKEEDTEADTVEVNSEGDIVLSDKQQSKEVMTLIKGKTPKQLIKLAQTHAKDAMLADWTLGGILYNVKVSGAYKTINDNKYDQRKGWEMFIDEQIGIDYRKAMYLVDIYSKFTRHGVKKEVAARLGWSKASRISAVMDSENTEELVELADDSSFRDLEDTIRTEYKTKGATKGTKIKRMGFRFRIAEEGGAIVADYLEQARNELGLDNLDDTFQHIVTEWSQEHLNLKKRKKGTSRSKAKANGTGDDVHQEVSA